MDDNPNRCAYRAGAERCANVARFFTNCTEQTRDARIGPGVCLGHFELGTRWDIGRLVLAASLKAVPMDFDYSSPNLVKLSEEDFEATRVAAAPPAWFKGAPDGR